MTMYKKIVLTILLIAIVTFPFVLFTKSVDEFNKEKENEYEFNKKRAEGVLNFANVILSHSWIVLVGAPIFIVRKKIAKVTLWVVEAIKKVYEKKWVRITLIVLIILPFLVKPLWDYHRSDYDFRKISADIEILTTSAMFAILALGLNITIGLTGLFVLGYAGFWAVGAYTHAILASKYGLLMWGSFPIALLIGAMVGLIVGLPSLRLRGDYLAIVTLGFGEVIRLLLTNLSGLTGGPIGITLDEDHRTINTIENFFGQGRDLDKAMIIYYLIFALLILVIIFVERISRSRFGRAFMAIREDETAAEAMGINTRKMKLIAFVISASIAALAGPLHAELRGTITPETFTFTESILVLSMIVIGGMGSTVGVLLGVILLWTIPEYFKDKMGDLYEYRLMFFGLLMIIMMIFRPQGIVGSVRRKIELAGEEQ